jgi:hypothetical protein
MDSDGQKTMTRADWYNILLASLLISLVMWGCRAACYIETWYPIQPASPLQVSPLIYDPILYYSACPTCPPCPTNPTARPTIKPTYQANPTAQPTSQPTGKKGVGDTYSICEASTLTGSHWRYNWTYAPGECPGVEDVPMIWNAAYAEMIIDNPGLLGGDSQFVMGFNEPNSQTAISPEEGAALWWHIEQTFPNKLLVSPAPSQYDPNWLVRMRDSYHSQFGGYPRFDRLAAHCYGPSEYCQGVIQQYIDWCNAWGCGGVWVTEFGNMPTSGGSWESSDVIAGVWQLVSWMEQNPAIERYAWFETFIYNDGQHGEWWWNGGSPSPNTPSLVSWNGAEWERTELGWWYLGAHTWR